MAQSVVECLENGAPLRVFEPIVEEMTGDERTLEEDEERELDEVDAKLRDELEDENSEVAKAFAKHKAEDPNALRTPEEELERLLAESDDETPKAPAFPLDFFFARRQF